MIDLDDMVQLVQLRLSRPESQHAPLVKDDFKVSCENWWNACIRSRRDLDENSPKEYRKMWLTIWLLTCLCLELCGTCLGARSTTGPDETADAGFMLGLVLCVAKASINDSCIDIAKLAMQRGAAHVRRLESCFRQEGPETVVDSHSHFRFEYYTLRTYLVSHLSESSTAHADFGKSWKEDRLDVADHMFGKLSMSTGGVPTKLSEALADVLQRVGASLCNGESDLNIGVGWLRRAHRVMKSATQDLSLQGRQLYSVICNDLVAAFLRVGSADMVQEAEDIVKQARSEIGETPQLCHSRMMIQDFHHARGVSVNEKDYADCLRSLIQFYDLANGSFHLVLYHFREFRNINSAATFSSLEDLAFQDALIGENDWTSRIVFTQIWLLSNQRSWAAEYERLSAFIARVYEFVKAPLPTRAAGLCHAVS